ncbi:UNVERIFIED_CONTAM: hypothetical protein FKN15_004442 [Acipenser sinensis]
MRLIDANASWPASVHDAQVFRNSAISAAMESDQLLPPNGHILGDSASPLETFLLTRYRDNGHLARQQIKYNDLHCCARSVIERCFAQLKGTFRRFKYLDISRADIIPQVIIAACVLHNIIIDREDNSIVDQEQAGDDNRNEHGNANTATTNTSIFKRDNITEHL